jgi:amino acid transporter
MIIGLIFAGLIIDLGGGPNHKRVGFQYWKNPGPLNGPGLEPESPRLDRFLGILVAIVQAAFGFSGMEVVRFLFFKRRYFSDFR